MLKHLLTCEVRWFDQGGIPADLQAWFDALGQKEIQPPRTDLYLIGLDASVGIKLRQGLLEIKPRQTDLGERMFLPGVIGRVGSWTKWSFPPGEGEWPGADSAHWLPVSKARQMLYYRVQEDGEISANPPGDTPETGGSLELTTITLANGQRWWTLGFEVIGPAELQWVILRQIVLHVVFDGPPDGLGLDRSYSYPYWLNRRTKTAQ